MSAPTDVTTLLAKYNALITAPATEITAWGAVTKAGVVASELTDIKVGLFGYKLDDFKADCVTLAAACKPADYEAYTGWAVGVNFAPSAAKTDGDVNMILFEDSKKLVLVGWGTGTNDINELQGGVATVTPTAIAPLDTQIGTPADSLNYFTGFGGKLSTVLAGPQFAFFLQKTDDTIYYEAGDVVNIWNVPSTFLFADSTAAAAATATTKNVLTAVTLVGAVSLTATAASVIVASLLF
jgi:hypothetical protein